jgi:hypothetical protein
MLEAGWRWKTSRLSPVEKRRADRRVRAMQKLSAEMPLVKVQGDPGTASIIINTASVAFISASEAA